MPEKETLLTMEGLKKLEQELEQLKNKRKQVADRIKQAIGFGDISENSEYEDAKNEQAFIEGRILGLEKKLRNVKFIEDADRPQGVVSVGSKVVIKDLGYDEELEYRIVGSVEAEPSENKISDESPVGKALLGQKVGSVVAIEVPVGTVKYEIMDILE